MCNIELFFSHSQLEVSQIFFNVFFFYLLGFWLLDLATTYAPSFCLFFCAFLLSTCLLKPVSKVKKKRRTDHKYVMAMRFRMRLK